MIILVIICSILYIIMISLLYYLYIEYKQDYKEVEERLLQLEKRINEVETNNDMLGEYYERTNVLGTIQEQILNYIDIQVKKENNTREGCECDMPCGRKKGRGGRRK